MNENRSEQASTWRGLPHESPEDFLLGRLLKAPLKVFSICLKAAKQTLPWGGTDLFLGGAGWGKEEEKRQQSSSFFSSLFRSCHNRRSGTVIHLRPRFILPHLGHLRE